MRDTEQNLFDDESLHPIHWIERLCASAWVRVI